MIQSGNIGVVLNGPFTPKQKPKVMQKVNVNINNVVQAFEWLQAHNILLASNEVSGENSDIELKEEIKVVFPDGTIKTGGCFDKEAFERVLADIQSKNGATIPYLISRPSAKVLKDYEDMNLMKAFPKQYLMALDTTQISIYGVLKMDI